ncbi:MAG: peptidyl-prolyl cis-trans isomerase [Flavobacteriaceae bacterium]|nr:peptidyl-prolyl cis-trans isomerase [Flavobacteriaceae bacterium]
MEIDELVENYRRELLIEKYKEALINKFLDTVVTKVDVDQYYQLNKDVYKLNEELVQIRFIHFNETMKDGKELIKLFKSKNLKDINALNDKRLEFNSFNLNDSIWVSYKAVQEKLPFLPEGNNLKKVDFLQKDDSLGVYLVAINKVLNINEIAPKSYVESTIKKMILHKRKLDLFVEIEKSLLSDAVEDNNFEVY